VNQTWTGDGVGDLYLGAKVNLMSESRQRPLALAVRGLVKVPTANTTSGNGTGVPDAAVDFIASKEARRMFEFSGYLGVEYLGQPSGFAIPNSALRWGVGAGFPSRSPASDGGVGRAQGIQQYSLDHQRFAGWRGRQPAAGQRDGAESDAGERWYHVSSTEGVLRRRGPATIRSTVQTGADDRWSVCHVTIL
jgi:hypothetical protein